MNFKINLCCIRQIKGINFVFFENQKYKTNIFVFMKRVYITYRFSLVVVKGTLIARTLIRDMNGGQPNLPSLVLLEKPRSMLFGR